MTGGMVIRELLDNDAPAVAALHSRAVRHSYTGVYSDAAVEAWASSRRAEKYIQIRERGEHIWVAEVNGTPIGFVTWAKGELSAIYVDPEYHGRGIGRALMAHADAIAQAEGETIEHVKSALSARGFYESMGFVFEKSGTSEVCGHTIEDALLRRP